MSSQRSDAFLCRRARRLLPALVAFLAVFVTATAVFGRDGWFTSDPFGPGRPGAPLSVPSALKGAAGALSYAYNILLARKWRMPAPLGHLWTLAVEGQFYLGWALLVSLLLRWRQPRP